LPDVAVTEPPDETTWIVCELVSYRVGWHSMRLSTDCPDDDPAVVRMFDVVLPAGSCA
jgi:hypothetical protein